MGDSVTPYLPTFIIAANPPRRILWRKVSESGIGRKIVAIPTLDMVGNSDSSTLG